MEEGRAIEAFGESGLMTAKLGNPALREIGTLFAVGAIGGMSDGQLIERFLSGRRAEAEAAFAALVDRHGPTVMGVCRRLLSDSNDADDAFQATFLVLVRKAHAIARRDLLANWLYGVAYRTARVARTRAAQRRAKEQQAMHVLGTRSVQEEAACGDLLVHLDEELTRLPEKFRIPVVLCELEGRSRKEVALRLGIAEGTLSSRLARARGLLRDRLAKRGLALGAGALAAGLPREVSAVAVRPALANATVQAALRYAMGGVVPGSVTTLTEGVLKAMFLTKLQAGAVALLALCTVAGLTALASARAQDDRDHRPAVAAVAVVANADPRPPRDPAEDAAAQSKKPPAAWGDGVVEIKGRVLTPDGKPIAGVPITLWWYAVINFGWHHHSFPEARPKLIATSGPDGTFRAKVPKAVVANAFSTTQTQRPWRWVEVVAGAEGYGPAWGWIDQETNEYTLRLVEDDVPVRGRVLDLQGRPVLGAKVWVAQLNERGNRIIWSPTWKGLSKDLKADKDGRFVLRGIGRDRTVLLHISGPTIEHKRLEVSTQKVVDGKPVDHKDVEIVAGPSKPIQGVVRAADTGLPMGGVWIYGGNFGGLIPADNMRGIRAMTDAQGRFQLEGMPKGDSYKLVVFPRDDQPYIMTEVTVGDTQGLAPVETEIKLMRGVLVRFRLVDKATGQPMLGFAHYSPYDDNRFFSDNVLLNQFFHRSASADERGVYSLVVPIGTGLITAFVGEGSYLPARVRDADRAKYPLIDRKGAYASMMVHSISHGYHMLDLKVDDQPGIIDIELDPGRKLVGTLAGPDGKPATGVSAYGQMGKSTRDGRGVSVDPVTGSFSVDGLDPERDQPRTILFVQKDRGLIGRAALRGNEPKPVPVRLDRWASATGRLVDKDGKAHRDATLRLRAEAFPSPQSLTDAKGHSAPDGEGKPWPHPVQTDHDGRFRIDGLAPGLVYDLVLVTPVKKESFMVGEARTIETAVSSTSGGSIKGLNLAPGEIRDLATVRVNDSKGTVDGKAEMRVP
jgi:RNA polymerase sigma factor (sigma-70 family)